MSDKPTPVRCDACKGAGIAPTWGEDVYRWCAHCEGLGYHIPRETVAWDAQATRNLR